MFTAQEKLRALRREIEMRRFVYPRRGAEGKMTQASADKQIAIFEEIAAGIERVTETERLL